MSTHYTATDEYFRYGPVDPNRYNSARSQFDGVLGFTDGASSVVNSIGRSVHSVADMRAAWAEGQGAANDVWLAREERELAMSLQRQKTERGDNVQMYYAIAAGVVAMIFIFR